MMPVMKKIFYLMTMALCLCMVSCGDDADAPQMQQKMSKTEFDAKVAGNFWKLDRGRWIDADGVMLETVDMATDVRMIYGLYFTERGTLYLTHDYRRTHNRRSEFYNYTYNPATATVCGDDGTARWNDVRIISLDGDELTVETSFGTWRAVESQTPCVDVRFRGIYRRMPMSLLNTKIFEENYKPLNYDPADILP